MRIPALALALLAFPTYIFSQDHSALPAREKRTSGAFEAGSFELKFPGSIVLRRSIDSMDDQPFCFISIASDLVGVDVGSGGAAVIQTPSDVDYEKPALLRIDDNAPIELNVERRKHRMLFAGADTRQLLVPLARSAEFSNALYTRRRLRLRYSVFPGPGRFDGEIKFGDFASAYDKGVELCGFRKSLVTPVHPSPDDLGALIFPGVEIASVIDDPPAAAADPLDFYLDAMTRMLTPNFRGQVSTSGKSVLAFEIERNGSVRSFPPARTELDRACLGAIRASMPFPPLPAIDKHPSLALQIECSGGAIKISRLD